LDTTKANLFFAKGVIFVEGWAEEILMPAIAKKLKSQGIISKDLTEAGISIVNIGNTAFLHYSRIYLRKEEPFLDIPVAIVSDIDLREYVIDDNGNIILNDITQEQKESKIEEIKERWEKQSVKVFIANNWTLEYALYKSVSLNQKFIETFETVHPQIDKENYEVELSKKLINKGLKKTEIAYKLAQEIETNDDIEIDENDESIKYLIEAIKYVSND
jgi:putative ATP-dependent endonuclease of OLD family